MNNDEYLDNVFMALSDRKRRKMLEMLSESQMLVTELGKPFGMSKQATSKHLGVLEKAGFVNKEKDGRVRRCALNPKPSSRGEQICPTVSSILGRTIRCPRRLYSKKYTRRRK